MDKSAHNLIKCDDYWTVHFAITHKIKDVFDAQNISMTYPHLNVHFEKNELLKI